MLEASWKPFVNSKTMNLSSLPAFDMGNRVGEYRGSRRFKACHGSEEWWHVGMVACRSGRITSRF